MNTELQSSSGAVTILDERQKKTHNVEANPNSKWRTKGVLELQAGIAVPTRAQHEGCRSSPVLGQFTTQSVDGSCCWYQFALTQQIMNFCCYGWGSIQPPQLQGQGQEGSWNLCLSHCVQICLRHLIRAGKQWGLGYIYTRETLQPDKQFTLAGVLLRV